MTHELSATEADQYERDGYLIRESVFSSAEVQALQEAAEAAAARAGELASDGTTYLLDGKRFVDVGHMTVQFEHAPGSDTVRVIEPVHELDHRLDALLDDPRLVEPMRDILGAAKISLWTNKLNLKRPLEGSAFPWHQDSPYWIHDCDHVDQLPNVMVTFDSANPDNGCFRVIRGSHQHGCLPGTADGSQLGGFYTDTALFDESDQVALSVPSGSLVFFHPHTVHGSQPNRSREARRAMIITYQPAGYPTLKSGEHRAVGG